MVPEIAPALMKKVVHLLVYEILLQFDLCALTRPYLKCSISESNFPEFLFIGINRSILNIS